MNFLPKRRSHLASGYRPASPETRQAGRDILPRNAVTTRFRRREPPHLFSVRAVPEHRFLHSPETVMRHSPDRLAGAEPLKPLYRDGRKMAAGSPSVLAIPCRGRELHRQVFTALDRCRDRDDLRDTATVPFREDHYGARFAEFRTFPAIRESTEIHLPASRLGNHHILPDRASIPFFFNSRSNTFQEVVTTGRDRGSRVPSGFRPIRPGPSRSGRVAKSGRCSRGRPGSSGPPRSRLASGPVPACGA